MSIIQQRRPVQEVIEDKGTSAMLREKLHFIRKILAFASKKMGLPDNGSYRHYADLGRSYVTWNVFAAPELSLEARQWCYLLVGCLDYRGYFSEAAAGKYARELQREGWDVYVGGTRAYSTLGWFRDPVLNTMIALENWELVRLIFHELAHQKVYLENDAGYNEAFAETVARIGLERWLRTQPDNTAGQVRQELQREDSFFELILNYRAKLSRLYDSALPRSKKRIVKQQLFDKLYEHYMHLKKEWGDDDRYNRWMRRETLNNGKLVAVSTYRQLLPDLMALYKATGSDLSLFYSYLQLLHDCSHDALRKRLSEYTPGVPC